MNKIVQFHDDLCHFSAMSDMESSDMLMNSASIAELEDTAMEASEVRDASSHPVDHPDTAATGAPPTIHPSQDITLPSSNTNTRPTHRNYTRSEVIHALSIIERIIPVDSEKWQDVVDQHSFRYPGRDIESIKQKMLTIYR